MIEFDQKKLYVERSVGFCCYHKHVADRTVELELGFIFAVIVGGIDER